MTDSDRELARAAFAQKWAQAKAARDADYETARAAAIEAGDRGPLVAAEERWAKTKAALLKRQPK